MPVKSERFSPLRIAVVSQYFWPEVFPLNAMAKALAARGHTVEVLTGLPNYPSGVLFQGYGWWGPWRETTSDGLVVKRVPLISRKQGSSLQLAANYVSFALTSFFLAPFRLRSKFDIVLISQTSPLIGVAGGLALSYLRGWPLVIWVQDLWPDSLLMAGVKPGILWRAMDRLMRHVYRRAAAVFVQSEDFRSHALSYGVAQENVHYVPNWADPAYRAIGKEQLAKQDAELPEGFRVMIAGNLGEAQDLETLVDAAKLLKGHPTVRIIVVGDGRLRPWLEQQIEKFRLAPTLTYIGYREFASLPRYFGVSDVLLLMLRRDPTLAKTIPSRLQAYLACGRPIVAALEGRAKDLVTRSGGGIAVAAGSPGELSDAIAAMADMPAEQLARMGQASLRFSREQFDEHNIVDRVETVLQDLAEQRS